MTFMRERERPAARRERAKPRRILAVSATGNLAGNLPLE